MKDINKIFFVLMARTESVRVPDKMLRPFNDEDGCLFEIACKKFAMAKNIPEFYISVRDKELAEIGKKYGARIWARSKKSTEEPNTADGVCDWWKFAKNAGKTHFIYMNPCSAVVSVKTIDDFVDRFLKSKNDAMFSMIEKKMLIFAEREGLLGKKKIVRLNKFLGHKRYLPTLESKMAESFLELGNALYSSKIESIENGKMFGKFQKIGEPEFFMVENGGVEFFDIDEMWQFEIAKELYKNRKEDIYK